MLNTDTTSVTVFSESKRLFAKLLATENITVEQRPTKTAYFDLKNRTLVVPQWKGLSAEQQDMLLGHEVGHALFTPQNEWLSACDTGKKFKLYMNAVEDARIERKIKTRYPGLKPAFFQGYRAFVEQDIFKLQGRNISELSTIDRLNLSCKIGAFVTIPLSAEERVFFNRMMTTETFDEVLQLTRDLLQFVKEQKEEQKRKQQEAEQSRKPQTEPEQSEESSDDDQEQGDQPQPGDKTEQTSDEEEQPAPRRDKEDADKGDKPEPSDAPKQSEDTSNDGDADDADDADSNDGEESSEKGDTSEELDDSADETDGEGDGESDEDSDDDSDSDVEDATGSSENDGDQNTDEDKQSEGADKTAAGKGDKNQKSPKQPLDPSKIDEDDDIDTGDVTENMDKGLDRHADTSFVTVTCHAPVYDLNKVVVPYKQVLTDWRNIITATMAKPLASDEYKSRVTERPRAEYAEWRKTNMPAVTAMVQAFMRVRRADQHKRALETTLGSLDCSKLHAYKFTDQLFKKMTVVNDGQSHGLVMFLDWSGSMMNLLPGVIDQTLCLIHFCRQSGIPFDVYSFTDRPQPTLPDNDTRCKNPLSDKVLDQSGSFALRQWFSSRMSTTEFNAAILNFLRIAHLHENPFPAEDGLGGTPLDPVFFAARQIVEQFKTQYHVDIVHAVVMTDGEASPNAEIRGERIQSSSLDRHYNVVRNRYLLVDRDTRLETEISNQGGNQLTQSLAAWFEAVTGAAMICFRLITAEEMPKWLQQNRHVDMGMAPRVYGRRRARRRRGTPAHTTLRKISAMSAEGRDLKTQFTEQKFLTFDDMGYSRLFLINTNALTINEMAKLNLRAAAGNVKLATKAFNAMTASRKSQRLFANMFAEMIAE